METEVVLAAPEARPVKVPMAALPETVQCWVWHGRFGTIVIEVRGDDPYVNGQKVEMASGPPPQR